MWETIRAFLYFDIDGTVVVGQVCEVVELDKIGREVAEFHVHEFSLVHGCVEVEILQINGAVSVFFVEMTLFTCSLMVIMLTVGVPQLPG
jgi:hypothetical protein